jgi:hypothetical protein
MRRNDDSAAAGLAHEIAEAGAPFDVDGSRARQGLTEDPPAFFF